MYTKKDQLLDVAGSEDTLAEINTILKKENISTEAYAHIFAILNQQIPANNDKLVYYSVDKEWRRDRRPMTDAKLFGLLNETCDFIRLFVQYSWEECLFSSWMSDKPLKKAEKTMDDMESLGSLQAIINCAAELMSSSETSARVRWEDDEDADSSADSDTQND